MTVGAFSEWRRLRVSLSELCISTTLRCGQSFRWHNVPDSDEWRCVLHGRLLSLRQDPTNLYYRIYLPPKHSNSIPLPTPPASHPSSRAEPHPDQDDILPILTHYFNLSSNLTSLYSQWSSTDPNFKKKAPQFTGIRILRQDAWEALVSFICSSNNNIARISQMVEKLCANYGPFIASIDGRAYHDFPPPDALTGDDVESKLRSLGFGYRAKYIYQTALIVSTQREKGWLDSLRNPESPALGVEAAPGGEMRPEGREGYREAHEKLLELQGVGPKVADCVSLMGLGWGEAVPVDTHVWQIAQRDYKFGKGAHKSLTKATYDAVGNHFRKLWGKEAGWAHSVLFTADLKTFSDRLIASKKTEVEVEVKDEPDVKGEEELITQVTIATAVGVKRSASESKVKTEPSDEKGVKAIVEAHTATRRMSKRLRNR
ncbi:8-oxoguanine glycosylase ogg1 [Aspergillus alliaceus]|uniref:DNA-(apurinic or apyrimidinic site) lyase n=1 Tax=Petromyces alliaceus TaxID=209559 RepID=A0A5N6FBJ1_PETAA|nr:DNA glycosylase [Aspergillus alliaceus]KAB8227017.1 DNA glycosylase [Aspergillus alliaceus]KAF5860072.1 8-oxoguanine glycosylase ogg1 [Aspergillus burnettii]